MAQAADMPHAVAIAGSAINVTDMDKEVKFYTDVVGLKVVNTMKLPNGTETLMGTGAQGGPILALAQVQGMEPKSGKESYGRVILRVTDNEAMAKAVVAAGGSIDSTAPFGKSTIYFVRDPEGFMLELLSAPPAPPAN